MDVFQTSAVVQCKTFGKLILCEDEDVSRISYLHKCSFKNKSENSWNSYQKRRNICTNLLRKTKRQYFDSLAQNIFHDTRNFKKTVKAYLYKLMQTFS